MHRKPQHPLYRVKYIHAEDGEGEVTLLGGARITKLDKAQAKAQEMLRLGRKEYTFVQVQVQPRPAARWEMAPDG